MTVEYFDYGIERIWLHDRRLVIIQTQGNMSRAAIDSWAEVVMDTAKMWSTGSPMLILHDLSHKNQGVTPYSLKRAEDTYAAVPDEANFEVYIAVLLTDNLLTRMVSVFLRRQRGKHHNVHERIFVKKDVALAWLESHLENSEKETTRQ